MLPRETERIATVVTTLRFLASGWVAGEDDQKWLAETADHIEQTTPDDWWTCPLCEESVCDDHCPLAAVRGGSTP